MENILYIDIRTFALKIINIYVQHKKILKIELVLTIK